VVIGDGVADRGVTLDQVAHHLDGLVRRVVEHLHVQLVLGIFQTADAVEQAVGHVLFVEDRKLHRDARQIFEAGGRLDRALLPVLVVKINQYVAMQTVGRQQDQNHEVGNQQCEVESVGMIEALEGPIQEMLLNVRTNALRRRHAHKRRQARDEEVVQRTAPVR
jgi:hypothetical protein